jgi:hypothetical protein
MFYSKKFASTLSISTLVTLITCAGLRADVAPAPHMATRFGMADAIVAGQVLAFEDQDRLVIPFPSTSTKLPYRIAVFRVTENFLGAKGQKTVRIGFPVPPKSGKPLYRYAPNFQPNQQGLFFLKKHFQEPFLVAPNYYDFINSNNNPTFIPQRDEVRVLARLLVDPLASLQSKNAEERLQTTAVLIARYRLAHGNVPAKPEPIAAEESRLILRALADADWNKPRKFNEVSPVLLFGQLGIGLRDGFQPKTNLAPNDYTAAMRAWVQEHAATYRIQRVVPTK